MCQLLSTPALPLQSSSPGHHQLINSQSNCSTCISSWFVSLFAPSVVVYSFFFSLFFIVPAISLFLCQSACSLKFIVSSFSPEPTLMPPSLSPFFSNLSTREAKLWSFSGESPVWGGVKLHSNSNDQREKLKALEMQVSVASNGTEWTTVAKIVWLWCQIFVATVTFDSSISLHFSLYLLPDLFFFSRSFCSNSSTDTFTAVWFHTRALFPLLS